MNLKQRLMATQASAVMKRRWLRGEQIWDLIAAVDLALAGQRLMSPGEWQRAKSYIS